MVNGGLMGPGLRSTRLRTRCAIDLHPLRFVDGSFAVLLDLFEMPGGERAGAERFGEHVRRSDRVLNGDIDADAADRGHGVGGVSDAEQTGRGPAHEMVYLDREQLDLVPGVDLGGAAREKWNDAFEALVEFIEAILLNLVEAALGDDVGDLIVVEAIDEDNQAAIVDVAEAGFRRRRTGGRCGTRERRWARPLRREAGERLPARVACRPSHPTVRSAGISSWTVGSVGAHAGDNSVAFDEADGIPAHAQGEVRITGCLRGEKVQKVPLRHQRNEFGVRGQVREVADLEPASSDDGRDTVYLGMANLEELVEEAKFVHQLQRGGMDGIAAKIAEEVLVLFEHGDGEPGAGEQKAEHDTGWTSTDDAGGLHDAGL